MIRTHIIPEAKIKVYEFLVSTSYKGLLYDEKTILIGAIADGEPSGILLATLQNDNAIVHYINSLKFDIDPFFIMQAMLEELERRIVSLDIKYLFCFYTEKSPLLALLNIRGWNTSINQRQYLVNYQSRIPVGEISLPKNFTIQSWDGLSPFFLKETIDRMERELNVLREPLPALQSIDHSSSFFFFYEDTLAGWLLTTAREDPLILPLARLYIKEEYRQLSVSNNLLFYSLQTVKNVCPFKDIDLTITMRNDKVKRVLERGYMGPIKHYEDIMRSYKRLIK
ncbi:hypothetical protein [Metabacillus fastidiosus]|uniref:hypothetical protein n=1 Tax=Metabacillus fastidiosus TaxID=1458 RepID=UPI003D2E0465